MLSALCLSIVSLYRVCCPIVSSLWCLLFYRCLLCVLLLRERVKTQFLKILREMDPAEEQQQELEVLESIYPDELVKHSDSHFSVKLILDTVSTRTHTLTLEVKYPPEYPEVVPQLDILYDVDDADAGDDQEEDEEDKQNRRNINLPEQVEFSKQDIAELLNKLNEEAELQVGMPSAFALVTLLKDEGEQQFTKKLNHLESLRDQELQKQEAEILKKFIGIKVTTENFNEWRARFRKEFNVDNRMKEYYAKQHGGKMTGREIFEKGLANEDDLVESLEQVKV